MAKRRVTIYEAFPGEVDTWSVRVNGKLYRAALAQDSAIAIANKLRIKEGQPGYFANHMVDITAHPSVDTYFK